MITANDVNDARIRIGPDAHRTPLLSSRTLGELAGGRVLLKAENLQRVGAFKIRGGLSAVRNLSDEQLSRGVVTYSSGNHGQAVALAARLSGSRAVVFMPETAPAGKVAAARGYGADVRFAGTTSVDRRREAERLAASEGLTVVPPFDHPDIIAGQGSVGLEILEQLEELATEFASAAPDHLLVPVGGGGLLAGVSLVLKEARPDVRIHGVEPEAANGLYRALAAGEPVDTPVAPTIADGLCPLRIGSLPFEIVRERVAGSILVTDAEIRKAVHFLLTRARLVVEPSGAVGVAALLSGKLKLGGGVAVVVLSGGNADPALLSDILQAEA